MNDVNNKHAHRMHSLAYRRGFWGHDGDTNPYQKPDAELAAVLKFCTRPKPWSLTEIEIFTNVRMMLSTTDWALWNQGEEARNARIGRPTHER